MPAIKDRTYADIAHDYTLILHTVQTLVGQCGPQTVTQITDGVQSAGLKINSISSSYVGGALRYLARLGFLRRSTEVTNWPDGPLVTYYNTTSYTAAAVREGFHFSDFVLPRADEGR